MISMLVYINVTFRLVTTAPALSPTLTLLWLCPFVWGGDSLGSRGQAP